MIGLHNIKICILLCNIFPYNINKKRIEKAVEDYKILVKPLPKLACSKLSEMSSIKILTAKKNLLAPVTFALHGV